MKPVKPTKLNIYVLRRMFADTDSISQKVEAVDFPHLKRCLQAGLLEADGKGNVRLTAAGRRVRDVVATDLGEWLK